MRPPTPRERLQTLHHLYEQLGSLEAVGRRVGLTRERVRQLLVQGAGRGLFSYYPRRLPCVSKEQLVADYTALGSLSGVARRHRLSVAQLKRLLADHAMTDSQLAQYRREGREARCVADYWQLVAEAGRHLSAGDLHRHPEGLALYARILRGWGSIHAFRAAVQIAAPCRAGRPPRVGRSEMSDAEAERLGYAQRVACPMVQREDLPRRGAA